MSSGYLAKTFIWRSSRFSNVIYFKESYQSGNQKA